METKGISRRTALLAPLLAAAFGAAATSARAQQTEGRALVAYVIRSGNARVIAGALSRQFNARLFEIRTAEPYPEDYEAHVSQARAEQDARATPKLAEHLEDLARFETVFLGSPVWDGTMPAPMRSFLTRHDLTGKTIAPFLTHGGLGTGGLLDTLAELAPAANFLPPFVLECDQERRTLDRLADWRDHAGPQFRF
ncbi:flavodoxin [Phaeovulum sp. W22_SRMD_FR3]|uniref:flavodoxin n=1 Tax=Phaeovulum sp. W22_SRMD_FR3 TaxID=3240274 RepID=UPI003F957454